MSVERSQPVEELDQSGSASATETNAVWPSQIQDDLEYVDPQGAS